MGRKAETSTRLPQRAERATGFGSPDADRPHWDVPSHWRNA
jgi:hypothetical protein